jgi:hypothetical protein
MVKRKANARACRESRTKLIRAASLEIFRSCCFDGGLGWGLTGRALLLGASRFAAHISQ